MKESKFQSQIKNLCKKRNARVVIFAGSKYQESGVSDMRVTHAYWKGWIELKVRASGHKLKPEQARFLQDHADRGDNALVVWLENDGSVLVQKYCPDHEVREKTCKDVTEFVELLLRRRDQR